MAEEKDSFSVPVAWVGLEDMPVLYANQFISQFDQDGFVLTFGQIVVPPVLGSAEEKREQVERISFVASKPVARLSLSRARVKQLITVLQENLDNYDAQDGGEEA